MARTPVVAEHKKNYGSVREIFVPSSYKEIISQLKEHTPLTKALEQALQNLAENCVLLESVEEEVTRMHRDEKLALVSVGKARLSSQGMLLTEKILAAWGHHNKMLGISKALVWRKALMIYTETR